MSTEMDRRDFLKVTATACSVCLAGGLFRAGQAFAGTGIAEERLNVCGGCDLTLLNIGEPLMELLPKLNFVHNPFLMDQKCQGQPGEGTGILIPEADIGIVSGGVRNEEDKRIAEEMRKRCKTLIALGTCACYGGIPALANLCTDKELYEKVYQGSRSTVAGPTPNEGLPPLLGRVMEVSEVVKVDLQIPGCPTEPGLLVQALTSVLEGKPFKLSDKSVCDECPTRREKKAAAGMMAQKRPLSSPGFGKTLGDTRCLMEQGFLCQGPATRAGCGGKAKVPRCIAGHMPCRGCFGPLRFDANPMVDMMGALSTIGIPTAQIIDRAAMFNRYAGAMNRLRPLPVPKKGGR